MKETEPLVQLVPKAVALAMGVAVVVLSFLNVASVETNVTLLGIGLFGLAVAALGQGRECVQAP